MSQERQVQLGRRNLTISHPDKLLFPDDGITKGGLLDHYLAVADHFPDWIATAEVAVKEHGGRQRQTVCNDQATLAYFVDQAVITPHPWLARTDRLEHPDVMIFDLDPPADDDFAVVRGTSLATGARPSGPHVRWTISNPERTTFR